MAKRTPIEFLKYWYFRYLLATELYMVETWEKITIHVIFAVLFLLFCYFNTGLILPSIEKATSYLSITSHGIMS